jgi:hypothetical protein
MSNITYYIGAGASFNAFPIQNDLCLQMRNIGCYMLSLNRERFKTKEIDVDAFIAASPILAVAYDLIYFGDRGIQFGTIDTYARKLSLLRNTNRLKRLKSTVNTFFTIWQSMSEEFHVYWTQSMKSVEKPDASNIDKRYFSLLSTILKWENRKGIELNDNVNFISWNYDLQIELAFSSFSDVKIENVNKQLSFLQQTKSRPPRIIHMNGYSGFAKIRGREVCQIDFNKIETAEDFTKFLNDKTIDFHQYVNQMSSNIDYAWEGNISKKINCNKIEEAKRLVQNTSALIIIGYSFPAFNRKIDIEILSQMRGRNPTIIYLDPKATKDKLVSVIPQSLIPNVKVVNTLNSGFIVPDDAVDW